MSHWYLQDGTPFHFQPDGRGTTLRHARKENALPSVTTILGILDKPALVNWKMKRVTDACYGASDTERHSLYEDYHKAMLNNAFAESTDARDRGSEIHNLCEQWFLNKQGDYAAKFEAGEVKPIPLTVIGSIAVKACKAVVEYCGTDQFSPELTVVGDGYGGMIDLHNDNFCIDWKTKDLTDEQIAKTKVVDEISRNTYLAWPEMSMQLSAYDAALDDKIVGMTRPFRRCINVFIDRTEPGKVVIHEWTDEEIALAWEKFQLLVKFWQLDKNYFPEQI